jgi:hypothetical protein
MCVGCCLGCGKHFAGNGFGGARKLTIYFFTESSGKASKSSLIK